MQTLANDPVVADTLTITHAPAVREVYRVDPGTELRWDSYDTDHHIIIVAGTCRILGRRIEAGGSAYIPAGVDHSLTAGAWGCSFLSVDR
jgi:quercetin dioxygenase-like cupin family protein